MSNVVRTSDISPADLKSFLADERANGFLHLSQESRLFALEFIQSGNHLDAAEAAGLPRSKGVSILRDAQVANFINYLNQQKEHYSLIDASFIEVQYLSLYSKLLGNEDVAVMDKEGDVHQRRIFHSSEAVSCLRDMAKISGHYKDDPTTVLNIHAQLTPEQQATLNEALDGRY